MQFAIASQAGFASALVFFLGVTATVASAQEKLLRWHDTLDRGARSARDSGKPLFVVFRCVR